MSHAPSPLRGLRESVLFPQSLLPNQQQVYVIIFGPDDNEGVHSLRGVNQDGLPNDTILAFEGLADAERLVQYKMLRHQPNDTWGARIWHLPSSFFAIPRGPSHLYFHPPIEPCPVTHHPQTLLS